MTMAQDAKNEKIDMATQEEHLGNHEPTSDKPGLSIGDEETARYTSGYVHISEAEDRRLFWKVCRRILPIMLITYFCQSLDKGTIGLSSIMGIIDEANLEGQDVSTSTVHDKCKRRRTDEYFRIQYSWLGTILYIGILAGEYPQNFLLQKLPVAKFLAVNVFLWGAVVACSAACTNFRTLMAVRFLLGFFESCVQPAFVIMYVSIDADADVESLALANR